jgi:hypothetical protein
VKDRNLLDRLLVEAAEREGVELWEWELERRAPRPVPVVASPVASLESGGVVRLAGPPEPPERSEEPPVAQEELAPVELDGEPVDPGPPRPEIVVAPRTAPQVVYGHAINLEAVEEQQPEPRPEVVRAPERPRLGPDAF